MSETNPDKDKVDGMLRELRGEFARRADEAGTVEAVAGGPVDTDPPRDLWSFDDDDLENELWSRILELDQAVCDPAQAVNVQPGAPSPAGPGPWAKFKSRINGRLLRLIWQRIQPAMDRQDRMNRRFKHLQFVEFLAVKRLRQRLRKLEDENRGLRFRLAEMEIERSPGDEPSGHE